MRGTRSPLRRLRDAGLPNVWAAGHVVLLCVWIVCLVGALTQGISALWGAGAGLLLATLAAARGQRVALTAVLLATCIWIVLAVGVDQAFEIGTGIFLFLLLACASCIPMWMAGEYNRASRAAHATLQRSELSAAAARRDERRYLARQLHDGIARDLERIAEMLDGIDEHALPEDVPDLRDLTDHAADSLTHLVSVLRRGDSVLAEHGISNDADTSLGDALTASTERLRSHGCAVEVHFDIGTDLPDSTRLLLVRALGEGTANILKHAPGSEVGISLARSAHEAVLDMVNTVPPQLTHAAQQRRGHHRPRRTRTAPRRNHRHRPTRRRPLAPAHRGAPRTRGACSFPPSPAGTAEPRRAGPRPLHRRDPPHTTTEAPHQYFGGEPPSTMKRDQASATSVSRALLRSRGMPGPLVVDMTALLT